MFRQFKKRHKWLANIVALDCRGTVCEIIPLVMHSLNLWGKTPSGDKPEISPSSLNGTGLELLLQNPGYADDFTTHVGDQNVNDEYDSVGAITYVSVVIVVYGVGVFALLCSVIKRKPHHRQLAVEIRNYKRAMEEAERREKQDMVLRTRLAWPGNFIGLRFSARHPRGSAHGVDGTRTKLGDNANVKLPAAPSVEIDVESGENSPIMANSTEQIMQQSRCASLPQVTLLCDCDSNVSDASMDIELESIGKAVRFQVDE